MPPTFNEYYSGKTGLTVGVKKVLFSEESPYQKVEVYDTDSWGRMMVIDGMVMLSEKDEFVYHEMLTHVGLFSHQNPERVLIIGGGDGGTAREVMRHPSVQHVDMVEIDETVVRASQEFLPEVGDWANSKLNIRIEDGISFAKNIDKPYDVIIIDGSDPAGPAEGLFEPDFIRACHDGLKANGVLTAQTESPWVVKYHPSMQQVFSALDDLYAISKMYLAYIPLYPTGMWSFCFASKGPEPLSNVSLQRVEEGIAKFDHKLKYYNRDIHQSCFALPNFVADILS